MEHIDNHFNYIKKPNALSTSAFSPFNHYTCSKAIQANILMEELELHKFINIIVMMVTFYIIKNA